MFVIKNLECLKNIFPVYCNKFPSAIFREKYFLDLFFPTVGSLLVFCLIPALFSGNVFAIVDLVRQVPGFCIFFALAFLVNILGLIKGYDVAISIGDDNFYIINYSIFQKKSEIIPLAQITDIDFKYMNSINKLVDKKINHCNFGLLKNVYGGPVYMVIFIHTNECVFDFVIQKNSPAHLALSDLSKKIKTMDC